MPRVFTVLILTLAIGSVRVLTAEEPVGGELPVTVQIHDYSHVSNQSLAHARDFVTATYKQIGVRTEWLGVVQQNERRPGSVPRSTNTRVPVPIAQITVIILTPSMAARGRVEEGALGFAAVPEEGMGRIAYAIYDRVRDTAARAAMNEDDLLGFVMAHEIAHLLLPRGAHTEAGLMRGHWNVRDFQHTDVLKLGFSPQQASEMRSTILRNTSLRSADTLAAGSSSVDACTATSCEVPVRQFGR